MSGNDICQQLQDKEEIGAVLVRYCRGADYGDEAILRSVFHPDATDDHAGMYGGKIEELLPTAVRMSKQFSVIRHALSNVSIKLDGDAADAESYVVATHVFEKDGETYHWLAGGRYIDRFERRNGEWRIFKRITHMDWSRIERIDPDMPKPF